MKSFRQFIENRLKESPSADVSYYALTQVSDEMKGRGIDDLDAEDVKAWIGHMLLGGMKASTCRRYVGRVHALYDEWRRQAEAAESLADPFDSVGTLLAGDVEVRDEEARHNLSLLPRILAKTETSADYEMVSIFLYLLYRPDATLGDVIRLTFDDADSPCQQVEDIIAARKTGKARKYVFKLRQGRTTDSRIAQDLRLDLEALMRVVGMRSKGADLRDAITSIWIAAALRAGIAPEDVKAVIGRIPAGFGALGLLRGADLSQERREEILCTVADALNDNASHWYAMRLRSGVDTGRVTERIAETLPGRLETMEIFAPTRENVRREGKRIVKETVPCLPGLVFFKTRANRVRSLFAMIGDLAWCYRTGDTPDSPYSVIPRKEMARFQRCVGQFTDDIRVQLVDHAPSLVPGRKVRVTGGLMAGYEGEITDVEGAPGMRVFSLRITDTARASWTAHVEDYHLEAL